MVISLNSFAKPALVFLGAGMGGLLRYWLGGVIQLWWGPSFPLGTLIINVTGCLVMGFLATTLTGTASFRDEYRMILLIGLLGGYTTFSTFGFETIELLREGHPGRASLYVATSVLASLFAAWIGALLAAKILGTPAP